jgi:hypothetical protein
LKVPAIHTTSKEGFTMDQRFHAPLSGLAAICLLVLTPGCKSAPPPEGGNPGLAPGLGGSGGGGGGGGGAPVDAGYVCNATSCADGCCSNNVCEDGFESDSCGTEGAACQNCASRGQVCGGDAICVAPKGLGEACQTGNECALAGKKPFCFNESSFGNFEYKNGYCTRYCLVDTDCGANGLCVTDLGIYGEAGNMCVKKCAADAECRGGEGYACLNVRPGGVAATGCFPLQAGGARTFTQVDAGTPSAPNTIGKACVTDQMCVPHEDNFCIPEKDQDGQATGYAGGFCAGDCYHGNTCGAGSTCRKIVDGSDPDEAFVFYECEQNCTPAGGGQGSCRVGYVCNASGFCEPT